MSDGGLKVRNQSAPHFIPFATVKWVDACLPAGRLSCKLSTTIQPFLFILRYYGHWDGDS